MNTKYFYLKKILILMISGLLLAGCSLLRVEGYPYYSGEGMYLYDPDQLLENIAMNNTDLFTETTSELEPASSLKRNEYYWTPDEYFLVLDVFMKDVLAEGLSNWQMGSLSFHLSCGSKGPEFYEGFFSLFRENTSNGNIVDRERILFRFQPYGSRIFHVKHVISPENPGQFLRKWQYHDLSQVRVTAENAIGIASANSQGRKLFEDNCEASLFLDLSDTDDVHWSIGHSTITDGQSIGTRVIIDALTGKIVSIE